MDAVQVLSRNVNRLRLSKRLTMQNLADISDMTPTLISNIERNKWKNGGKHVTGPGLKTVEKLANALGVSISSLLTDDMTMISQGADCITNRYLSLNNKDRLKMEKMIDVVFDDGADK